MCGDRFSAVTVRKGPISVLLGVRFFARRDEFRASQPEGRKRIAQCVSTGKDAAAPQPRDGAEEPPGLLLAVPFAACRYVGEGRHPARRFARLPRKRNWSQRRGGCT